jgi:hypothetical protein
MRIRHLLIAGALLSASLIARADTFTTFTLNSSFFGGGTIDGTLTLDTTTDLFTGADLTASGFFPGFNDGTLSNVGLQGSFGSIYNVSIFSFLDPSADLNLFLPVSTLAGFDGSPILDLSNVTFDFLGNTYFACSGNLEPGGGNNTSVTPEPGSLLLLATGLMGMAGLMWRKFAAA